MRRSLRVFILVALLLYAVALANAQDKKKTGDDKQSAAKTGALESEKPDSVITAKPEVADEEAKEAPKPSKKKGEGDDDDDDDDDDDNKSAAQPNANANSNTNSNTNSNSNRKRNSQAQPQPTAPAATQPPPPVTNRPTNQGGDNTDALKAKPDASRRRRRRRRRRRNGPTRVAAVTGPIQVTKKLLDSPLDDIQWADLSTVFVLSERGKVYRSETGGRGWTNQATKLKSKDGAPTIKSIHISPVDRRKVFFMGARSENWVSFDMGKTYKAGQELDLHEVRTHPVQSHWMLGASMSDGCKQSPKTDCYKVLYVTKDFAASWHLVTTYVVQFDWAPLPNKTTNVLRTIPHAEAMQEHEDGPGTTEQDLIYATVDSVKKGNQKFGVWDKNIHFYQTYDYFKTSVEVVPHGNRFLFGLHNYLFVAAVNPNQETEVSLQVSRDSEANKRFRTALLPVDLTEHSYTILDTSEGAVFLHVNHAPFDTNAPTGHVYISDWSGTRFSLSLPYNHRSPDGKCDFEKVEGIEGIYLANFIDEEDKDKAKKDVSQGFDDQNNKISDKQKRRRGAALKKKNLKTKTVVTFDKGAIWSYLEPPKVDSRGKPIQCPDKTNCHLHLHGITDLYGPFYSSSSATGLIMSTGTVGSFLQERMDKINTYLSRDAGLTWFEVAKGSHIYEFGDHGGLIVMAYDEGETDHVLYTWDQGITWNKLRISESPLQVENIIIEPEATSQAFVVYGWQDNNGVLIFIDFDELHEKQCQGYDAPGSGNSDYELWSPSDGRLGGKCLMGHKVTYVRRKRESQCYNPEKLERSVVHDHCACTREDFECDYGYMRKTQTGACERDPDVDLAKKDKECDEFYYVTKGYRRVAGDTCTSGEQWDRIQAPCPTWTGTHIGKVILIILVLIVVMLACATFYSKSEFLEDCVDRIRGRYNRFDYHKVGKKAPHSMDDDDDFGLDNSEFGQTAHLLNKDKEKESVITGPDLKPLPERRATPATMVPTLSKPPGQEEEFNPRK